MDKRRFLEASLLGAMAAGGASGPAAAARKGTAPARGTAAGPTLLTVSGLISAGNRGALDPALDQLMAKQKLAFAKAQTFDFAALTALPATTIQPTIEYDGKPHALSGPLLVDVMAASGVAPNARTVFFVRAIDGYAAQIGGGRTQPGAASSSPPTSTAGPWRSAASDRSGRSTTPTAFPRAPRSRSPSASPSVRGRPTTSR